MKRPVELFGRNEEKFTIPLDDNMDSSLDQIEQRTLSEIKSNEFGVLVVILVIIGLLVILNIFVSTSSQKTSSSSAVNTQEARVPSPETAECETLMPGGKYVYNMRAGETTGWKKIPGNCIYDVQCDREVGKPLFLIYYNDGTVVDFTDGINKELPTKTLAQFTVASRCNQKLIIKVWRIK